MLPTYNMSNPVDTTTAPLIDNQQGSMTSSYPQPTVTAPQGTPAQAVPVQTMPAQPYPGQIPTQPIPGQPYPGQPYPGQPYPGQPYPGQPMPGQPIPVQPIPGQPMPGIPVQPAPMGDPLEQLMNFPGIRIVENVNLWEVISDYSATKRYAIFLTNEDGDVQEGQLPFFNAFEESECCQRQMCGQNREFDMNICGPDGQLLVKLHRPFTCQCFCLNTPEMHILDANGTSCGMVKNQWHCFDRIFYVMDEHEQECMTIRGSCLQPGNFCFGPCEPCNEIVFDVTNNRTGHVGHIKRRWDNWARQLFTNADTFTILFPPESTLHERLLLLAATFLLNLMFFERTRQEHDSAVGGAGVFGSVHHHHSFDNDSYGGGSVGGGDFDGGDFDGFDFLIVCF